MAHVGCNAVEKMPWAYFLLFILLVLFKKSEIWCTLFKSFCKKEVLEMQMSE